MSLFRYIQNLVEHHDKAGIAGLQEYFGKLYARKLVKLPSENIYERDWDILLILDACRFDLVETISSEFEFLGECGSMMSPASVTKEWMKRTFNTKYLNLIEETVYVCGNPYSATGLNSSAFATLDEVWRYAWDEDLGTVPPRPVTDRAIEHWRSGPPKRMICHYMQPHTPFIGAGRKSDISQSEFGKRRMDQTWVDLQKGHIDSAKVWEEYIENLRYCLEDVQLFLDCVDAENVVVSSDHGNAFGEFGIYGHPEGAKLSSIRKVPWCKTSGKDVSGYKPDKYERGNNGEIAKQRLIELGYY